MAIGVLVGFWVVLGLGVLLVAMRATRRSRTEARESKGSRRLFGLGAAVFFIGLGAVVPAAVMINDSKADDNARGGVDLTKAQVAGRQMFAHNCSTCHTLATSNAVGLVGPDLDQMRPNEALVLDAIKSGRARGMGQMPAELVTGPEARDVASYVAAVAGR
jgi:mono/diheme cytochrome c family protein